MLINMYTLNSFVHSYNSSNPDCVVLSAQTVATPIGKICIISDDTALYYCDFIDNPQCTKKIERLLKEANAMLTQDSSEPMRLFEQELQAYFAGTLTKFNTPVALFGTPFTVATWRALQTIPYGHTVSYAQLAAAIGKPTAWRAVARANSMNLLPIIIPCHRIINANGDLGGYNSGIERKNWLLELEKSTCRRIE